MNAIHKIIAINEKELSSNVSDQASWHADYSDTSYIYIGNLHEQLAEKDILIIFSQYGNPTHINLVKDRETGKSRGFCYLKYEDHRSCVLAIDNFNGTLIYQKPLKVDHTYYKLAKGQSEDDFRVEYPRMEKKKRDRKQIQSAPKLLPYEPSGESKTEDLGKKDEKDPAAVLNDDDFSDPMRAFKKDDDFSDPMAAFKKGDDFSDPMAVLAKDDDFEDPMAGFVGSKSKSEERSTKSRRREGDYKGHDHRTKRHRSDRDSTHTGSTNPEK